MLDVKLRGVHGGFEGGDLGGVFVLVERLNHIPPNGPQPLLPLRPHGFRHCWKSRRPYDCLGFSYFCGKRKRVYRMSRFSALLVSLWDCLAALQFVLLLWILVLSCFIYHFIYYYFLFSLEI